MNYREFRTMLDGFEKDAAEHGLDLDKIGVTVSLDIDNVLGKDETGNRIFGTVDGDWFFDHQEHQFVIGAEYKSDTSEIRISKIKED